MAIYRGVKPFLLLCSYSAIFVGCGGSGGDNNSASDDAFSPSAYTEATLADENLSGVWLMLEEYDLTSRDKYVDFETNAEIIDIHNRHAKRRELFVIADAETSPTGMPRISGCDRSQQLAIEGNSISFIDDGATYTATLNSNTRISGSSDYQSDADASDDSPSAMQSGTFTLIKLAPLSANFALDASSDAYGESYTKMLEPIGTVAAKGQFAGDQESFNESGSVTCFSHIEGTYSESENSVQTAKGSYIEFWAGKPNGLEVQIYQETPDSKEGYMQIEAYKPPYAELEVDNSEFDVITGTSTLTIDGIQAISVEASISGAHEGDAEASIEITVP
jgi:hypothetical protein